MPRTTGRLWICVLLVACILASPQVAHAYIGPGAGFAFVSSFFILFLTIALAFFTILTWPLRYFWRWAFGKKAYKNARTRRLVILGLDGQDPELTERWMAEGLLPNFSHLRQTGGYARLRTSLLSESPVAWSCFQTGCNPGRHRIYDFLVPNRKSHLPELSSAQIEPPARMLKLGRFQIPLSRPIIRQGRKSQPFWNILGQHGIFSAILRVPITFPPEKFNGLLLSAMCVPDLQGSQGIYFYYSSQPEDQRHLTSGKQLPLTLTTNGAEGDLIGPPDPFLCEMRELKIRFRIHKLSNGKVELRIGKTRHELALGQYTPWISVSFRTALGMKIRGLCKFYLLECDHHIRLYVPPIQIDPAHPALPIAHPLTYSVYLAKTQGPFATLGVAEDTSALNEGVIDEEAFLQQAWSIHDERERMYFDALAKVRQGLVCCVFDITDRLQHMFFRCLDDAHPANAGRETAKYRNVLRDMYVRMDELLGRTMQALDPDDVLLVMSDHGFKSFRRGVNLNTWLWRNGYLALKTDKPTGADMLQDIDWTRTRAYCVGFGGIYLNMAGREARGIVAVSEAGALKAELRAKLLDLIDSDDPTSNGSGPVHPIKAVYDAAEVYRGPYAADAPDLIAGFRVGHRVSWAAVTGGVSEEIFENNTRPWSGDHNMNPPDVPGILFSNRAIESNDPHITDVAATALDLFGVEIPSYFDGRSFMTGHAVMPSSETIAEGARK